MNLRRTRLLCIEIYKTVHNLNPEFMKNFFKISKTNRAQREQYRLKLEIPKSNQVSSGTKCLRIQGSRLWKKLPFHIEFKENLQAFKYVVKFWDGSKCSCLNSNIYFLDRISLRVTLCMYQCILCFEEILQYCLQIVLF